MDVEEMLLWQAELDWVHCWPKSPTDDSLDAPVFLRGNRAFNLVLPPGGRTKEFESQTRIYIGPVSANQKAQTPSRNEVIDEIFRRIKELQKQNG